MEAWLDRQTIAYTIIGVVVFGVVSYWLATRRRRKAARLRRRGIKTYGH